MDVLLARDGDLLRLIFERLDVVVDVEDVFVELGKVVELRGGRGRGGERAAEQRLFVAAGRLEILPDEDRESRSSPPS